MRDIIDDYVINECYKTEDGLEMYEKCINNPKLSTGKVNDKRYTINIAKSIVPHTRRTLALMFNEIYNSTGLCVDTSTSYISIDNVRFDVSPTLIKALKFLILLQVNKCSRFSENVADVVSSIVNQIRTNQSTEFSISYTDGDKFSQYVKSELVSYMSEKGVSVRLVKEVVHD